MLPRADIQVLVLTFMFARLPPSVTGPGTEGEGEGGTCSRTWWEAGGRAAGGAAGAAAGGTGGENEFRLEVSAKHGQCFVSQINSEY